MLHKLTDEQRKLLRVIQRDLILDDEEKRFIAGIEKFGAYTSLEKAVLNELRERFKTWLCIANRIWYIN
jgi:hypothetical protein